MREIRALFRAHKKRKSLPKGSSDDERVVQLLELHGIDTVLDVGANEGQYGCRLRAAGYPGRIVSVEPSRAAHATLLAVAAGDPDWIVAERIALGAEEAHAKLQVFNRSDMNSLRPATAATLEAFPKLKWKGEETVPVRRLDGVIDTLIPDFDGSKTLLKIDTQGSEDALLEGAGELLEKLRGIQIEVSFLSLYDSEKTYLEVLARLAAEGWSTHLVLPGFFSRRLCRQLQADFVLFREPRVPAGSAAANGNRR